MDFVQLEWVYIKTALKTLIFLPLIVLLSIISAITSVSLHFLLPNLILTLLFFIAINIHPAILFGLIFGVMLLGLMFLMFKISEVIQFYLQSQDSSNFNNSKIFDFIRSFLLGITLINTSLLALCLPWSDFYMVNFFIKVTIMSLLIGFYQILYTKFFYQHILAQEQLQTLTDEKKLREEYIMSYEKILEKLPERLQNVVERENIQRDYIDTISHELLFSPVKLTASRANYVYEKTSINDYFRQCGHKDPITQLPLLNLTTKSEKTLKEKINRHRNKLQVWVDTHSKSEMNKISENKFIELFYS